MVYCHDVLISCLCRYMVIIYYIIQLINSNECVYLPLYKKY